MPGMFTTVALLVEAISLNGIFMLHPLSKEAKSISEDFKSILVAVSISFKATTNDTTNGW